MAAEPVQPGDHEYDEQARAFALSQVEDFLGLFGASKCLGDLSTYNPFSDVEIETSEVVRMCRTRGLEAYVVSEFEAPYGDNVFVFHPQRLQSVLLANAVLLHESRWPIDADAFVKRQATEFVAEKEDAPLHQLIAVMYGSALIPGNFEFASRLDRHYQAPGIMERAFGASLLQLAERFPSNKRIQAGILCYIHRDYDAASDLLWVSAPTVHAPGPTPTKDAGLNFGF